jgi:deoxyribodipyrimidine photo-lyase
MAETPSKKAKLPTAAAAAAPALAAALPAGPPGFQKERVRAITATTVLPASGECVVRSCPTACMRVCTGVSVGWGVNLATQVYWMSRDQRPKDNWALLYARWVAETHHVPLHVVFCLVPKFLEATIRHFGFMLKGLQVVETHLREKAIPFHLLEGYAKDVLPAWLEMHPPKAVVCDMSPLRVPMGWVKDVGATLETRGIPLLQVSQRVVW